MRLLRLRSSVLGGGALAACRRSSSSAGAVAYVQGQSPEPKVREYFYYVDHQGQLFLDDTKVKNFVTCFKGQPERTLPGPLPLPVPVWQRAQLPALRRPTRGLHAPAAGHGPGSGPGPAVLLWRRPAAVGAVPTRGAVHGAGLGPALPPLPRPGRGRGPGEVGARHRTQPVLGLRRHREAVGTQPRGVGRSPAAADQ
ncbi:UPF0598 protein C8orf82 homolog isoform X2 [Synchiropus splendidus]|uniref:UPF0598 protein C8orf82 homolog isoform X2 n=1 Tax=Synchiropus splendidus TaxID=270530 RepID=UPI00237E92C3|nr:UPF0598 protein C8orf82 homolog isoform X2 [Synchiropus splendidus]